MNKPVGGQQAHTMSTDTVLLNDRTQISELLSRYCGAIDDKCISITLVAATFLPDGSYVAPNGVAIVGLEAIATRLTTSFSRFRATHHVTSDHIIDFDGNTARLRANMTAMHLWSEEESDSRSLQTHFVAGGVFEAVAVRATDGWRFSQLAARITWRTGAGLPMLARMGSSSD